LAADNKSVDPLYLLALFSRGRSQSSHACLVCSRCYPVLSIRRNNGWIAAICIVLLVLKPQNGVIFALYGAYWLFRHHKGALAFAIASGSLLLGISLAMQPEWIGAWLGQVKLYNSIVHPSTLLPLGIVVLVVCWRFRLEWWAKVAIIQVILFPLSDIYSTLPLLLAWCAFPPLFALAGTSLSWLWVFSPVPISLAMVWLLLLLPLLVTIFWESRPKMLGVKNAVLNMPNEEPLSAHPTTAPAPPPTTVSSVVR
jgi:hypothetical protein